MVISRQGCTPQSICGAAGQHIAKNTLISFLGLPAIHHGSMLQPAIVAYLAYFLEPQPNHLL